jgi:hypothetical protein
MQTGRHRIFMSLNHHPLKERERMPKVKTNIHNALKVVGEEIHDLSHRGDGEKMGELYARGTASEGYAGGYRQALQDIILVMNGIQPDTRDYWKNWKP